MKDVNFKNDGDIIGEKFQMAGALESPPAVKQLFKKMEVIQPRVVNFKGDSDIVEENFRATVVQKSFSMVKRFAEKNDVVQFGLEVESNGKYTNTEGRRMERERKVNSFTMTANVVKKFEESGPFPWRAGDVERIVGL